MNLITLLTDFGNADYFVGAMKGAILNVNPEAKIIDITHESNAHDIRAAGFTLLAAYSTFPKGAIHVCVVDPGVGSKRRAILAVTENYFFVAPDNGVLSLIYQQEPETRVFQITNDRFFRLPLSTTFHGRDVFAPVAGAVSRGVLPAELGTEITDFVRYKTSQPVQLDPNTVQGEILHIDHFGNCITNLSGENLSPDFETNNLILEINGRTITRIQSYFAEMNSAAAELFMIFGSAGFLEIAAFQKSAADILQAKVADTVFLRQE